MKVYLGIDLGSTTTKAILLDEEGAPLGRGITNSRSDYHLAADIARDEAFIGARFTLLGRALRDDVVNDKDRETFSKRLLHQFRKQQYLSQLSSLRTACVENASQPPFATWGRELVDRLEAIFASLDAEARRPQLTPPKSEFFRDRAGSAYGKVAESRADKKVPFDTLMGVYDKSIIQVENKRMDLSFSAHIRAAVDAALDQEHDKDGPFHKAVERTIQTELEVAQSIGTGYGRARLPFPKDSIRSEILCHGLGAHAMFPKTATVLDIGGQDTKAIQVDRQGIVTSFQMNDRCAAGCGRYLGYIADEMSVGVHELGPLAMQAQRTIRINSTCTVFAGAELRDRLSLGQRREDILAGLHRAIILRAMALLARSGGVDDEFTFTGGVANNVAAVKALRQLIQENYGDKVINISPDSIYTGALGAAIFALRQDGGAKS